MNFFQRQEQARRASRWLVLLFVLAVLAVVCAVDAVIFFVLAQTELYTTGGAPPLPEWMAANVGTVIGVSSVVAGIIGLASLYKSIVLRAGGGAVARMLGGVRVSPDTTDPNERRLLNVVEEMSIASGVPMPEVYLLEHERGINAFAAGHNPADAAIGVTRGAIETLSRAELQGVIAHEFSHILNGDMRLNLRLIGLLFGLLVIALIARTVLRVARDRRSTGSAVALVALAVLGIGYIGLFFGRLIQAAVSRRREALADASAVQFTRDPTGLRNALVKIAALAGGSKLTHPEVEEVAHMLFAPGMNRLFATHPPLMERIKAIDPHFDVAEIEKVRRQLVSGVDLSREHYEAAVGKAREGTGRRFAVTASLAQWVGNPSDTHMRVAREIRESLPQPIVQAARHPTSARGLLLALALDACSERRAEQRRSIGRQLGAQTLAQVEALEAAVDALAPEQRLPALMQSLATLRQLPREESLSLLAALSGLLQQEGELSLHRYALCKLAQVQLRDGIDPVARRRTLSLALVRNEAQVLFAVLARYGHEGEAEARRAYEIGMHHLYPRDRPPFSLPAQWPRALDVALSRLDQLVPAGKEQLIEALLKTVTHDQRLTIGEAELLRTVCAALHCPLPPLVDAANREQGTGSPFADTGCQH
ncbi:MAG: M48 family metallopeptidase [Gammaproteobacteria bacterium]|nr:peptidase M48 Ste24p [Gammaproteobacteria bacterium]